MKFNILLKIDKKFWRKSYENERWLSDEEGVSNGEGVSGEERVSDEERVLDEERVIVCVGGCVGGGAFGWMWREEW